jgi:hypothetical protein
MSFELNNIENKTIKNYEKPTISSMNHMNKKVTQKKGIIPWLWLKIGSKNALSKTENDKYKSFSNSKIDETSLKCRDNNKNATFKQDLFNHRGKNVVIDPFNHRKK